MKNNIQEKKRLETKKTQISKKVAVAVKQKHKQAMTQKRVSLDQIASIIKENMTDQDIFDFNYTSFVYKMERIVLEKTSGIQVVPKKQATDMRKIEDLVVKELSTKPDLRSRSPRVEGNKAVRGGGWAKIAQYKDEEANRRLREQRENKLRKQEELKKVLDVQVEERKKQEDVAKQNFESFYKKENKQIQRSFKEAEQKKALEKQKIQREKEMKEQMLVDRQKALKERKERERLEDRKRIELIMQREALEEQRIKEKKAKQTQEYLRHLEENKKRELERRKEEELEKERANARVKDYEERVKRQEQEREELFKQKKKKISTIINTVGRSIVNQRDHDYKLELARIERERLEMEQRQAAEEQRRVQNKRQMQAEVNKQIAAQLAEKKEREQREKETNIAYRGVIASNSEKFRLEQERKQLEKERKLREYEQGLKNQMQQKKNFEEMTAEEKLLNRDILSKYD